jgi:threonyl-tRNA synthetase
MLIIGEKEAELNNVSVRKHRTGDIGVMMIENFIKLVKEEISKSISKFEN